MDKLNNYYARLRAEAEQAREEGKNYTQLLSELNNSLPKGITATTTWYGSRLVITYQVRFMLDGARVNLGTFVDLMTAIRAMLEYKMFKMFRVAQEELQKKEQLIIHMGEAQAISGVQNQQDLLTSERKGMLNMATRVLHPDKLQGKVAVDFTWTTDLGGNGETYTITPAMLRAYYADVERTTKERKHQEEQNKWMTVRATKPEGSIMGSPDNVPMLQPVETPAAQEEAELSDEEYNKLMGLDD